MIAPLSRQKRISPSTNSNPSLIQKKDDSASFFKSEGNENSFFSTPTAANNSASASSWPESKCDLDSVSDKVKKKNLAFSPINKISRGDLILYSPKRLIKKHFDEYKSYLKDCWDIDLFWDEYNNTPQFGCARELLRFDRGNRIELAWKTTFPPKSYPTRSSIPKEEPQKETPQKDVPESSEIKIPETTTPESSKPDPIPEHDPVPPVPEKDPCEPDINTTTFNNSNSQVIPGPSIQFNASLPSLANRAAVVAAMRTMLSGVQLTGTYTDVQTRRSTNAEGRAVVQRITTTRQVRTIIEIDIFTGFVTEGAMSPTAGTNNITVMLGRFRNVGGILMGMGVQANDFQRGRLGNGLTAGVIWNATAAQRMGNPNLVQFTVRTNVNSTRVTRTTTDCPTD